MASIGKWSLSGVGITTVLSAGLNTLGIAAISAPSSTYDNSANLDLYVDIEVALAALTPGAGPYVTIYVLTAPDGTNFSPATSISAADLRLCGSAALCTLPIGTTASTAQRVVARNILLPPTKIQFILDNQTGVALNASGNTVKVLPYDFNLNG